MNTYLSTCIHTNKHTGTYIHAYIHVVHTWVSGRSASVVNSTCMGWRFFGGFGARISGLRGLEAAEGLCGSAGLRATGVCRSASL